MFVEKGTPEFFIAVPSVALPHSSSRVFLRQSVGCLSTESQNILKCSDIRWSENVLVELKSLVRKSQKFCGTTRGAANQT